MAAGCQTFRANHEPTVGSVDQGDGRLSRPLTRTVIPLGYAVGAVAAVVGSVDGTVVVADSLDGGIVVLPPVESVGRLAPVPVRADLTVEVVEVMNGEEAARVG